MEVPTPSQQCRGKVRTFVQRWMQIYENAHCSYQNVSVCRSLGMCWMFLMQWNMSFCEIVRRMGTTSRSCRGSVLLSLIWMLVDLQWRTFVLTLAAWLLDYVCTWCRSLLASPPRWGSRVGQAWSGSFLLLLVRHLLLVAMHLLLLASCYY